MRALREIGRGVGGLIHRDSPVLVPGAGRGVFIGR
jgi:hypothetical protein